MRRASRARIVAAVAILTAAWAPPRLALAESHSARSHYYTVEALRPSPRLPTDKGPDAASFSVVFYGTRPSPQFAETALRSEMEVFARLYRPNHNVLGIAWYSANGNELNEEKLKLPNGPDALLFEPSTGKIRGYDLMQELKKSGLGKR